MSMRKAFIVYKKELSDILRDRRTLLATILIPLLLYPVLFTLMSQSQAAGESRLKQEKSIVALDSSVPEGLAEYLQQDKLLSLVQSQQPGQDLQKRRIHAHLTWTMLSNRRTLIVHYDGARVRSRLAQRRLGKLLRTYRRHRQEQALARRGIPASVLDPVTVKRNNTASPERMGGRLLGVILPLLLIVSMTIGAMYPAIDLTAGEKERGTLETILSAPVSRQELLTGKFLTVTTSVLITGAINLFSMMMTYSLGLIQLGAMQGEIEFRFMLQPLLVVFLLLVPVALFISGVMLAACLFARSFKDAQNLVTPVYILLVLPALVGLSPGLEVNSLFVFVPITNICLLFREVFLGHFPTVHIFSALLANSFYAVIAILAVGRIYNAEKILFAEERGWHFTLRRSALRPIERLSPQAAMLLASLVMLLLFYAGSLLQLRWGLWGLFVTEWLLIFTPAALVTWYRKLDLKTAWNLRGFWFPGLAGTILLWVGSQGLALLVARLQLFVFPEGGETLKFLERFMNPGTKAFHPLLGYLVIALTPALCEEVLFRGLLLSALRQRLGQAGSVVLIGFLFGLFHLHFFRILPATVLGIYLGYVVVRTGSLWLGIIGHLLNNAFAYSILVFPEIRQVVPWISGDLPPDLSQGLLILACLVTGSLLLYYRPRSAARESG